MFGTKIIKTINLEEWESYLGRSELDASKGKFLVVCN
jgi:hypothetical protein